MKLFFTHCFSQTIIEELERKERTTEGTKEQQNEEKRRETIEKVNEMKFTTLFTQHYVTILYNFSKQKIEECKNEGKMEQDTTK
jgi:hypothetical protein